MVKNQKDNKINIFKIIVWVCLFVQVQIKPETITMNVQEKNEYGDQKLPK